MSYVYKMVNSEGEVLYVGRTLNLKQRVLCHRGKTYWADWKEDVIAVEFAKCKTVRESMELEARMINEIQPPFNKHGSSYEGDVNIPLDWNTMPFSKGKWKE